MDEFDEIVREFLVESLENLDQLDRDLVALEEQPGSRPLLSSVFRTIHTIKGTSGFLAFGQLERLTHVGENLLVQLRDGKRSMDQRTTDVLLAMVDRVRDLLAAIEKDGTEGDVAIDDVVTVVEAVLADVPAPAVAGGGAAPAPAAPAPAAPASAAPAEPAPPAEPAAAAPAAPAVLPAPHEPPAAERTAPAEVRAPAEPKADEHTQRAAVTDAAIRVDVALLDALVRQVGELVLARNRISRLAAATADVDLVRSAQRLDLIAGELQEGVMRTRMQPMEHLWSKMPRIVRDLAAACGREVQLDLAGGETELDRSLLEAVRDPLTHLVRNAVDHGIEPPDVRVAAGKPAKGRLTLRALHSGGQVVIEVADDGRGIDAAAVAAKAVERGLRTPEQVAAASTAELLNLLFLPGFSTAASVTNVSGRGVGMDVVRTKIEAVGGTVDVETTPGAGTVWRLRMPLTLAIIPALTVECGGRVYAVPQTSVVELVAADGRTGTSVVEHVHGAPVYRLRGRLLPLVLLGSALGVSDLTQPPPGSVVVVLQVDRYRFGLVVDRVLTTEEIVVEALSARLKGVGAYAGATVLGDGELALILDLQALARRHLAGEADAPQEDVVDAAQAETGDPGEEVLVVSVDGRRLCLPSELVTRLEPVRVEQLERVGGRDVVRYRGDILPLARVDRLVGAGDGPDEQIVVVLTRGARTVGLVVHGVVDVDRDHAADHSPIGDVGLLGSTVVGGRVTERLDWRSAVLVAEPTFLDEEPETADELVGAAR